MLNKAVKNTSNNTKALKNVLFANIFIKRKPRYERKIYLVNCFKEYTAKEND